MNLLETLLNQAKKNQLAHFYLIESSAPYEVAFTSLLNFTHQFIQQYYQKIEGHKQSLTHLMDHPDVNVLGSLILEEKEKPFFTVAEAEEFSRFFEFKPVQGQRKFAVITEAHRINPTVANKWLKLLEEPQGLSTIFVLNPRRQKLLDTIHSRALHLRLSTPPETFSQELWLQFLADTKAQGLSQFLETRTKAEQDLMFWNQELIRWEAEQSDESKGKEALGLWLKNLQEMEAFHQPSATKWTLFYSYLKQHVLPRL